MATSPAHRFGQIIGELLEEIMTPQIQSFCNERGLYLDKKGARGKARNGQKVSWLDKYGNTHDLDFVIEKGGSKDRQGRPIAFIEAAWRRYAKHSRNKAQEIQGAILPIAEKYIWDKPFLGVILAGVFTDSSIVQMKSSGFEVALFPYETIVAAFKSIRVDAEFDENTPDSTFQKTIEKIESLEPKRREKLKQHLINSNSGLIDQFFKELQATLDRQIEQIILLPLYGQQHQFETLLEAVFFVKDHREDQPQIGLFKKYEILIRYTNGDKIEASFQNKEKAIHFLNYIEQGIGS